MPYLRQVIREANFSGGPGRVFPFSKGYAAWETDEIISMELYRNVALAFLCIFLTTLPLLSDLLGCAEVLLSVVLTMVNVSGLMHFWGKRFFIAKSAVFWVKLILVLNAILRYGHLKFFSFDTL